MMGAELRPATTNDIDALLSLWAVAAENDSRPIDTADMVRTLLARDPDACTLAVENGRVIGSLIAGWDGWRAHLYRLAVHPDARRRGIAAALLGHAEQRFRALGAIRIDAMVLDANDLGQSLWTGAGYTRQRDWRRWVLPLTPR